MNTVRMALSIFGEPIGVYVIPIRLSRILLPLQIFQMEVAVQEVGTSFVPGGNIGIRRIGGALTLEPAGYRDFLRSSRCFAD